MADSLITQVERPDSKASDIHDESRPVRKPKLKVDIDDNTLVQDVEARASQNKTQDVDNRQTGMGRIFSRQFTPTIPKTNFFGGDKTPKGKLKSPKAPKNRQSNLPTHDENDAPAPVQEEGEIPAPDNKKTSLRGSKTVWQSILSCFISDPEVDTSRAPEPRLSPTSDSDAVVKVSHPSVNSPKSADNEKANRDSYQAFQVSPRESLGLLGPRLTDRKCLVLDLDETLVHSSFKPVPNADFVLSIEMDNIIHKVYVLKRPGVDEFLVRMAELYEVVIFTASLDKYANPLLDLLDTHKTITGRLYREHCSRRGPTYVKDLSKLGRPLCDSLIIDNSPHSYAMHPNYAVPILSWFDDPNDTELIDMIPFLENLTKIEDVSHVLDASKPWRVTNKKLNRLIGIQ